MKVMEGTDALRGAWGWTGLTAAFVAALGALAIAPAAWADDTMPAPPIPAIADVAAVDIPDAGVTTGDIAEATSEVGTTVSEALSESGLTAGSGDTTSETGDTAAGIAESPANTGQSTGNSGDAPPVAPTGSSPATQAGPTNVNVNVRIDSPGNDGAVNQSNVASAGAPAGIAAAPTAALPMSSSMPSDLTRAQDAVAESAPSSPSGATSAAGTWTWTWDCATPPTIDAPALVDENGQAVPWNWTWIWNCGGNAQSATSPNSQYQPATANETTAQYQPGNVNISIRINSPGDNGPVIQANVAISVAVPGAQVDVSAGATVYAGAASSQVEVHVDMQLSASSENGSEASSENESDASSVGSDAAVASASRSGGIAFPAWPAPFGLTMTMTRDGYFVLTPCRCARTTDPELTWVPIGPCGEVRRQLHGLRGSMRRDDEWFERCFDAPPLSVGPCRCLPPGGPLTSEASGEGGSSGEPSSRPGTAGRRAAHGKYGSTIPSNRPPIPVAVSGAALGSAPSGSSSGGALPVSLLIPVAVAALDLCRRVAVAKVVWPRGRRGGTFDPPG